MEKQFKLNVTPQIHLTKYVGKQFQRFSSIKELHDELDQMRINVKAATEYSYDNTHVIIDDCFGRPAISLLVTEDEIFLYQAHPEYFIMKTNKIPSAEDISFIVTQIEEGKSYCPDCKNFVTEGKSYSFTGFVCNDCYDAKKHLSPCTLGD